MVIVVLYVVPFRFITDKPKRSVFYYQAIIEILMTAVFGGGSDISLSLGRGNWFTNNPAISG